MGQAFLIDVNQLTPNNFWFCQESHRDGVGTHRCSFWGVLPHPQTTLSSRFNCLPIV